MLDAKQVAGPPTGPPTDLVPPSNAANAAAVVVGRSEDIRPSLGAETSVTEAKAPRGAAAVPRTPPREAWASPDEFWAHQASATLPPLEDSIGKHEGAAAAMAKPDAAATQSAAAAVYDAAAACTAAAAAEAVAARTAAATELEAADLLGSEGRDAPFENIFVFTNPTSGGNKAAAFTKVRAAFSAEFHLGPLYDLSRVPCVAHVGPLSVRARSLLSFFSLWLNLPTRLGRLSRESEYPELATA